MKKYIKNSTDNETWSVSDWIDYIDQDLEDEYGYTGPDDLKSEYDWAKENLQEISPALVQLIYYALHPEELTVDIEKKK